MLRRSTVTLAVLALAIAPAAPARAGVVNPDISVIGQPVATWTNAAGDAARKRVTLDAGETEFMFDADLNPYARGTFIASLARDGFSLEEGYFTLQRGLPWDLAVKAGKYRVGFGKLNPAHPHTYPFAARFHVLAAYLPGADGFDDTGIDVSKQLALPGDIALTASADWLQGDGFRRGRVGPFAAGDPLAADSVNGDRAGEPRPAALGRLAAFVPVGDRSGVELGLSGTQGTNDVAAATRTAVFGADVKAKLWRDARSYLLVQAEALHLVREDPAWDAAAGGYAKRTVRPSGGYLFADWAWALRYDVGASYEDFGAPETYGLAGVTRDRAFGAFAGLALMEETTAFRVGWERFEPHRLAGGPTPDAVDTITLRVIYSMGPHKAHQF